MGPVHRFRIFGHVLSLFMQKGFALKKHPKFFDFVKLFTELVDIKKRVFIVFKFILEIVVRCFHILKFFQYESKNEYEKKIIKHEIKI